MKPHKDLRLGNIMTSAPDTIKAGESSSNIVMCSFNCDTAIKAASVPNLKVFFDTEKELIKKRDGIRRDEGKTTTQHSLQNAMTGFFVSIHTSSKTHLCYPERSVSCDLWRQSSRVVMADRKTSEWLLLFGQQYIFKTIFIFITCFRFRKQRPSSSM